MSEFGVVAANVEQSAASIASSVILFGKEQQSETGGNKRVEKAKEKSGSVASSKHGVHK